VACEGRVGLDEIRFDWGYPPQFPDLCVGCGRPHPSEVIRVRWWQCTSLDPAFQLWTRISQTPFPDLRIPACSDCQRRYRASLRTSKLFYVVGVVPSIVVTFFLLRRWFGLAQFTFSELFLRRVLAVVPGLLVWSLVSWMTSTWPIVFFTADKGTVRMSSINDEFIRRTKELNG
jgi:hypothetical protein